MATKLRNISVVAGLTVVSRVLGLVRDQVSAAVFGTSALASAFVTAFRLPNLFRRLLGEGSLTAALVPTLQETMLRDGQSGAFRLLSQVASWLLLVSGAIVTTAMLLASQARRLPGHEERWYLSADLAVLLFPYLICVCLAAVFSAMLNVLQRFTEPALSPVWLNLAMIAALGGAGLHWAETPYGRMLWLCGGVLAGGALQMLVPALVLVRLGWRPRFDLERSAGVRDITRLMAPGLWGTAIYQVNLFVAQMLAMSINDSAATLLFFANRLMELPIGVFAIAVATVVYPSIAKHAAAGDAAAMSSDYGKGVRLIAAINLPAAAGLALLAIPIIRVLFQRGEFTAADTAAMAPLLAAFALGMPFFSVVSLMTRAFYAVKDTSTPVKVATISFVINVVASLALMRVWGAFGLALASTLAVIAQTVLLQRALTRRLPRLAFGELARDAIKILAGTAAMSAVVWLGWHFLSSRGRGGDWLALGVLIPLAVVVYGAVLWGLRLEGREDLLRLWRRRRSADSGT
ncbi:MAG TPA: murein biosynthesis integral membrane protein MurJ [Candidatus Synoicihabitans sp.]|nr:murein biosynthesis integral membrane protein MurJ [Candidatus Synoicihabitans sp.]